MKLEEFVEKISLKVKVEDREKIKNKLLEKYKKTGIFDNSFLATEDEEDFLPVEYLEENKNLNIIQEMESNYREENEEDAYKNISSTIINKQLSKGQAISLWEKFYANKKVFTTEELNEGVNKIGMFGRTQLHEAVLQEDFQKIEKMLNEGVDASIKDNNGNTAFKLALMEGKIKIVDFLKQKGISK
jgi:ankyrin repeat protein